MPQTRERVAGPDVAWLHMDRADNPMVVNTLLELDQRPDWEAVERALSERVVKPYRRFRQRPIEPLVTAGAIGPRWGDERTLDITPHIVRVTSDACGTADDLHAYIGAQAGLPLPRERPMWQAHFIDGPGHGAALLLRTHHALADGAALVKVILELTDDAAARADHRSTASRAGAAPRATLVPEGATLAKLVSRLVPAGAGRQARLSGTKAVATSAAIPLARLKDAGKLSGGTVNDVMLATVAGALGRYRRGRGEPPHDMDVVVPVDLRRADREPQDELGNKFGLVFVTLPISCDDTDERISRVAAQMRAIKSSHEARVVFGALHTMGHVPPAAERAWVDGFVADAGAVVTNIAGPRHAVALAGTPVTGITLWVPSTGPVGLGVSLLSYDGRARLGLIADRAVIPDIGELADALEQELQACPCIADPLERGPREVAPIR